MTSGKVVLGATGEGTRTVELAAKAVAEVLAGLHELLLEVRRREQYSSDQTEHAFVAL
jgi:hypothetical protein